MKWITLTAALMVFGISTSSADAGLFGCHKKNNCCPPAPCCEAAPVYHAPAPCCEQAPVYDTCCAPRKKCGLFGGLFSCFKKNNNNCCAPAPCCEQAPVYHAPAPCCEQAPVYDNCCAPKKKCGLFGGGLFSCFKKKSNNCCGGPVHYAPAPACSTCGH